jgi:hypothetical protein
MCSLHNVHEMNTYMAGHACLSICMIQLENRWMDLEEIWYGHYAIGDYPKIVLYNFLQSVSGQTNLRGGTDTSATCNRAIQ